MIVVPRYHVNISDIPSPDDVELLFKSIEDMRRKAHLALFWRTGARPAEINFLQRRHIKLAKICRATWRKNLVLQRCGSLNPVGFGHCLKCGADLPPTQYFIIKLPTKKLGEQEKFKVRERELRFIRPTGMALDPYIEAIVTYTKTLPADESRLFPHTIRHLQKWLKKQCLKVLGKAYCPYHFRHARFTLEGQKGMGVKELQQFKGAASVQSVLGYLHSKPFEIEVGD